MLEGLYSAAAGMAAQQRRIDGVSNDLANASTTGYKHVRVGFRDLLYNAQGGSAGPTVLAGAGAAADFIGRSQEQGALQTTGQPLDVAIQGPGFLQVKRPDGSTALTRDGSLRLDSDGRLTTKDGLIVQPQIAVPRGTAPDQLSIGADGTVRAGAGRALGRIDLVAVRSPAGLQALGGNLFAATAQSGTPTRRRRRHDAAPGRPGGLERRHRRRDGRHDRRAAQLPARRARRSRCRTRCSRSPTR